MRHIEDFSAPQFKGMTIQWLRLSKSHYHPLKFVSFVFNHLLASGNIKIKKTLRKPESLNYIFLEN